MIQDIKCLNIRAGFPSYCCLARGIIGFPVTTIVLLWRQILSDYSTKLFIQTNIEAIKDYWSLRLLETYYGSNTTSKTIENIQTSKILIPQLIFEANRISGAAAITTTSFLSSYRGAFAFLKLVVNQLSFFSLRSAFLLNREVKVAFKILCLW